MKHRHYPILMVLILALGTTALGQTIGLGGTSFSPASGWATIGTHTVDWATGGQLPIATNDNSVALIPISSVSVLTLNLGNNPSKPTTTDILDSRIQLLEIYPNPASGNTQITLPANGNQDLAIEVYNILGSKVLRLHPQGNSYQLSVEHLPKGIYFVCVLNARGERLAANRLYVE